MSVYSWGMRSPYGRIFAQPEPPDALQARHGDLWVSPLGLQFFSRTPGQVGSPGTGVWTAVQMSPAVPVLTGAWTNTAENFVSGSLGLSGQINLTTDGVIVTNDTFTVSGLAASLNLTAPVFPLIRVAFTSSSALLTGIAGVCTAAAGVLQFTVTTTGPLPIGTTISVSFYAY